MESYDGIGLGDQYAECPTCGHRFYRRISDQSALDHLGRLLMHQTAYNGHHDPGDDIDGAVLNAALRLEQEV